MRGTFTCCERAFREPAFGNLRGRKLHSDRNALAVDHHHALRTFPATRFADCRAPFFAVTKVASRKASSQSSNRRWSSMDNSFRQASSQTLALPTSATGASRLSRPDTVRADRAIWLRCAEPTKCPPNRSRFEAQGRPRPSLRRLGSGNKGAGYSTDFRSTTPAASS